MFSIENENQLGMRVQIARMVAQAFLDASTLATRKATGSSEPETWEDRLRDYATDGPQAHRDALKEFQEARAQFWAAAYAQDAHGYIVAKFRESHASFRWLEREEQEGYVLLRLPYYIERWNPERGTAFLSYALRGLKRDLRVHAAQQGAVEIPRNAARQYDVTVGQESIRQYEDPANEDDADGNPRLPTPAGLAFDPTRALIAHLDGELTPEGAAVLGVESDYSVPEDEDDWSSRMDAVEQTPFGTLFDNPYELNELETEDD